MKFLRLSFSQTNFPLFQVDDDHDLSDLRFCSRCWARESCHYTHVSRQNHPKLAPIFDEQLAGCD